MIKKSVKKKASKKVIDYDPLAWLEEGEDKNQQEESASPSTIENQSSDNAESQDNTAAFGFFDDDPVEEVAQAASTDEDDLAYGFFDDAPISMQSQSARIDADSHTINLGAELTIRSVSECKALIDQLLHQGEEIKLQVNELQKIDSAGLQMLYSLKKTLDKSGQKIHWMSSGAVVNEVAQMLGLPELADTSVDEGEEQQENSAFGFF